MATASLGLITKLGTSKSYLKWFDPISQRWLKEQITDQAYDNLAKTDIPLQPLTYTGNNWSLDWRTGKAVAFKGRPDYSSSVAKGKYEDLGSGKLTLYTDDMDNGYTIDLFPGDYIGIPPLITVTAPLPGGITVVGGIITVSVVVGGASVKVG